MGKYDIDKIKREKDAEVIKVYPGNKVMWKCKYDHIFTLSLKSICRRGKWCKQCGSSIGERIIRDVLIKYSLPCIPQYVLTNYPRYRYDYYTEYDNKKYLIEFDGIQHFQYVKKYHKTKQIFKKRQKIDAIKSVNSMINEYQLIRIDYTQINDIEKHILIGLTQKYDMYVSTPQLYEYLGEEMEQLK